MKIAFQSNQLRERGTEIALYDYAYFNKTILNNDSIIISHIGDSDYRVLEKFKKHFPVYFYNDINDINSIVDKEHCDVFYSIRYGYKDFLIKDIKNCIHTVFGVNDPHGDVYAYVSSWLSERYSDGKIPYVPHMINLPDINEDMRAQLNIPKYAIVYGRIGGFDTFNIPFVMDAINRIVNERNDIYFILVNTNKFTLTTNKKIIFLPSVISLEDKVKFINTCDVMIHARSQGETFGIAIGEFSIKNKPIVTYAGKCASNQDLSHVDILREKGIYYEDYNTIYNIFKYFEPKSDIDWNAYREYLPTPIMHKFNDVFLK